MAETRRVGGHKLKAAWFAKVHYQTWLCLRYADLAFAVSSPGLGKMAIPNHIY
jgi:hypothetical protein